MSGGPIKVIGLAGGIGAGKSTVASLFAELGAAVVDADRIAHEVIEEPSVRDALRQRWGEEALDAEGRVDRGKVGRIVFEDPEARAFLEGLVHPRVRVRMKQRMEDVRARGDASLIVVDAALLLEAGLESWCDAIVFVEADEDVRDARVRERSGWEAGERARRESAQMSPDDKRARSDSVIVNNGELDQTRRNVREWFEQFVKS